MCNKAQNGNIITFTKMHGIGNDYIYIDCTTECLDDPEGLSIEMSPRHTSVGADGIILITRSAVADFGMRIFNADGSEARMCGNGSRCIGKYVYDHRMTDKVDLTLETLSGVKHLRLHVDAESDTVDAVTVDMGAPILRCSEVPVRHDAERMIDAVVDTSAGQIRLTAVSMGNPHGVIFFDTDPDNIDVETIGPELECHTIWPDRANIEIAQVIDAHTIKMRVWERGSGETMACGTGACAAAVAGMTTGRVEAPVKVMLRGGTLDIDIDRESEHVLMTGPAEEVYTGYYKRKMN